LHPDEAKGLPSRAHETAERADTRLAHRLHEQPVRPALALCLRGHEEVRAVEPHGVDVGDVDEAGDLDRTRVAPALDRLELLALDDDELAFRDLPAAHELVLRHFTIVFRAPPLLLDRGQVLAMQ